MFCSVCFNVLLFMFSFELLCCCLCCYMCFFDCKCKSLKRLGENITQNRKQHKQKHKNSKNNTKNNRNTVYPALDPTANKYLSGSGWEICCFGFFLELLCFVSVSFCFRLVFLSFCIYNRTNTYTNITKT